MLLFSVKSLRRNMFICVNNIDIGGRGQHVRHGSHSKPYTKFIALIRTRLLQLYLFYLFEIINNEKFVYIHILHVIS